MDKGEELVSLQHKFKLKLQFTGLNNQLKLPP